MVINPYKLNIRNNTMTQQSLIYEYDDIEQARMVRDIIRELIKQNGAVLQQRNYYKYLEIYYEQLNNDVGEEAEYYE
ncbi:MAG: hypothetical protein ACOYN6_00355 [Ignavibacteria bacterium]